MMAVYVTFMLVIQSDLVFSDTNTTAVPSQTTAQMTPTVSTPMSTTTLANETCNANDQNCSTTTTKPPHMKHNKTTKWKSPELQPTYYKFKTSKYDSCHCDLQNNLCDINCCCDKDCSLEAKQVFSLCKDKEYLPKPNKMYCNYVQYIYNNRTLHEEEVEQNSLFCIAKANLPAKYYLQKQKTIINPLHASETIKKSPIYQWSNYEQSNNSDLHVINYVNQSALYGDKLIILRNYSKPLQLEIPDSFISPDCVIHKEIQYLNDASTSCKQALNYQNSNLFVQHYLANITIISTLQYFNNSLMNYYGCPQNICIPIDIKQCNYISCWNFSQNVQTDCNSKACNNIVESVKFKFYHNGTRGVQKANLELILINVTLPMLSIDQHFEVKFLWINQSELNYTNYRSGNPGYLVGAPIMYGKLITIANTTTNTTTNETHASFIKTLQRPHDSYIQNFLVFPKNVKGKCVLSNKIYEPLEFGYNMLTKCMHSQGFIRRMNMTANETCALLQNNILAYWSLDVDPHLSLRLNETHNYTFAFFGNAATANLSDWGHLLFDVYPEELLNGSYGKQITNNLIECQNISTLIKLTIFYERLDEEQARISAIYVEFAGFTSVQLKVFNNNVFPEFLITSESMFYDITGVRNMKYVDPPSFNIKLPYDFFYPFVRVENSCKRLQTNSIGIIILVFMLLITVM